MKTAIRFIVILGVICLVMGGGVAVLYATFKERIAQKEAEQFELALRQVLPDGRVERIAGSPADGDDVYRAADDSGTVLGYAARGAEQGYSSKVKILVGFEPDAVTIRKVIVLDQQETPGLGANVNLTRSSYTLWQKIGIQPADEPEKQSNEFLDRFSGRAAAQVDGVDAMPAATITSNAVKNGVAEAGRRVRQAMAKE